MVNNEHFNRGLSRFQLQAKLLLERRQDRRPGGFNSGLALASYRTLACLQVSIVVPRRTGL